jgi:phosphopantetheinyl transferase (holo-ACP synthase)
VQGYGDALRVSISHTEDWVAAAVANVPIGIDLEQRSRRLDDTIEPLLLNAGEAPGSLSPDALLQRWVAKEAWVKRDVGSALPERLWYLHLGPSPREQADVVVDSSADFHFGLAVAPRCSVTQQSDMALRPTVAFAVSDADAGKLLAARMPDDDA